MTADEKQVAARAHAVWGRGVAERCRAAGKPAGVVQVAVTLLARTPLAARLPQGPAVFCFGTCQGTLSWRTVILRPPPLFLPPAALR